MKQKINNEQVEYPMQKCLFSIEGYFDTSEGKKSVYEKQYKKYIIFSAPI